MGGKYNCSSCRYHQNRYKNVCYPCMMQVLDGFILWEEKMMKVEKKTAYKVLNKLMEAGYKDEKAIVNISTEDILALPNITVNEISIIMEIQKAVKSNKVVTFLAGKDESGIENGK